MANPVKQFFKKINESFKRAENQYRADRYSGSPQQAFDDEQRRRDEDLLDRARWNDEVKRQMQEGEESYHNDRVDQAKWNDEVKRQMQEGKEIYNYERLNEEPQTTPIGFDSQMSSLSIKDKFKNRQLPVQQDIDMVGDNWVDGGLELPQVPPANAEVSPPKRVISTSNKPTNKNVKAAEIVAAAADGDKDVVTTNDIAAQNANTQAELAKSTVERDEKELKGIPSRKQEEGDYRDNLNWLGRMLAPSPQQLQAGEEGRRWNHILSSGDKWVLPGQHAEYVRRMAESESKAMSKNSDLANQRERSSLKREISDLGKMYVDDQITEDQYNEGMDNLSDRYREAYGYDPVRINDPTTQSNRTHIIKPTKELNEVISLYNRVVDKNTPETIRKMMGFNIMKQLSGDVGQVSDKERVHFLYALMPQEFKDQMASELSGYINYMRRISQKSGDPQLTQTLRNAADKAEELLKQGKIGEAISHGVYGYLGSEKELPMYKEQIESARAAFEAWERAILWHAPVSTKNMAQLLESKITEKENNLRLIGKVKKVKTDDLIAEMRAMMSDVGDDEVFSLNAEKNGNYQATDAKSFGWNVPKLGFK